jgi:hypothetical protein
MFNIVRYDIGVVIEAVLSRRESKMSGDDIFKVRKSRKGPKVTSPNVYALPSKKTIKDLVERAREISEQLDEVKPLYNELDQITYALIAVRDDLHDFGVTIADNFAGKNTQFKTVGMRRYELKWVHSLAKRRSK